MNPMKYLGATCLFCLASCTNLYQWCFDLGAEYEGVEVEQQVYRCGGKHYVKGKRADFRRVNTDPLILIGKPVPDSFRKIDGTEREPMYREVSLTRNERYNADSPVVVKVASFAEGSQWISAELPKDSAAVDADCLFGDNEIDGERRMNAHALYAYPLGAVAGALVDAPLNALCLGFVSPLFVCSLPALAQSQQQQLPPPPQVTMTPEEIEALGARLNAEAGE